MRKIILILMVFCLGGCGVVVKNYNPLPSTFEAKKIFIEEPRVYERYEYFWWIGNPDKVTEQALGERRTGVEDKDAREAINAARAFQTKLKQMLNKKFVVVENMENPEDCIIIKTYISYRTPVFRGHLSRNAYFRGHVIVFMEVEYNKYQIARLLTGGDYSDRNTWMAMPLEKKLILALDYLLPKIEQILGG